jgi:hypothetical protein
LEQKDGELTIKGISPNEASVTRFGQSLEFSSGLFTNLNIETQRELAPAQSAEKGAPSDSIVGIQQPEVVAFTLKCSYGTKQPVQPAPNTAANPANQVALKK